MIEIIEIKKKKNKYVVILKDEEIEVSEDVLIKMMLLKKRDITTEEYKELLRLKKYYDRWRNSFFKRNIRWKEGCCTRRNSKRKS